MTTSMTAFASAEIFSQEKAISVEIRSYNGRNFDLELRAPKECAGMEDWIKKRVSKKVVRGRVEMCVRVEDHFSGNDMFEIDGPKAAALHKTFSRLKEMFNLDGGITLDHILKNGDVIKPAEVKKDMEIFVRDIKECVNRALEDFMDMRKTEGDYIRQDFLKRIDYIDACVETICRESKSMLAHYKKRLIKRISELTNGLVETDPGRIDQEAAFLADKSDVSEEIIRVESHLKQFREILKSEESPGRKLNFLIQELNREFNTIGSKTGSVEASRMILDVKSELEKIREQAQNIE